MGWERFFYNLATDKSKGIASRLCRLLLLILSLLYGLLVTALAAFNQGRASKLASKVISVGNLTLGGTGKTALVEYLAGYFKKAGVKVAILSRGYKKTGGLADEPEMLRRNLGGIPVIIGSDRVRSAKLAKEQYRVDLVILDDGFQQWKIKKDLEIVTIDATNPFGNGYLIPRGILREPLPALKRADIFVLTKVNLNPDLAKIKDRLSQVNPKAEIFESRHRPTGFYRLGSPGEILEPEALASKQAILFSGIADPDSFDNLLISLGVQVIASFKFPDHYQYTRGDLERIFRLAGEKKTAYLITTEKDAARLGDLSPIPDGISILVLRIKISFLLEDEEQLLGRLQRLYSL